MGRAVRGMVAGTKEQFDKAAERLGYPVQVWNAEVYIGRDGKLNLVVPEVRVKYFPGRSGMPTEQDLFDAPDAPFVVDEKEFQNLIGVI